MMRLLFAVITLLLCSGFMGFSWYEKYGISKNELNTVQALPKIILALNSDDPHDVEDAANQIEKFKKQAKDYVPELVKVAQGEICTRHSGVFIRVMNAAISAYDSKSHDADMEKLLLTGLTHTNGGARYTTCRNLQKLKFVTNRIMDTLDTLSKYETNRDVKEISLSTLNQLKLKQIANNIQPEFDSYKNINSYLKISEEVNPYAIAVVIGNMDYISSKKSVPNVDYALNDSKAIKDFLVNVKGYRDGNIIYIENATQADMVSTFGNKENYKGKLFNWVRSESDVFVYYSGHGAPSLKDGAGYLLPVDSDPSTVELNGYPLDTLYQNIGKLQAKSITIVIDACFSGSSQGGTITKSASSISLKPIAMPKAEVGINILAAANVGEIASWDTEAQHGLFTSYFIKGLGGAADKKPYGNEDRQIDLAEVQKYLNLEVTYMARRNYGRDQNPQINGNPSFVFSTLKE